MWSTNVLDLDVIWMCTISSGIKLSVVTVSRSSRLPAWVAHCTKSIFTSPVIIQGCVRSAALWKYFPSFWLSGQYFGFLRHHYTFSSLSLFFSLMSYRLWYGSICHFLFALRPPFTLSVFFCPFPVVFSELVISKQNTTRMWAYAQLIAALGI